MVRIVVFMFLLPNFLPCQSTYDSLLFQLDTARSPQIKVDVLNKIGFSFMTTTPPDLAMAKNYLEQSLTSRINIVARSFWDQKSDIRSKKKDSVHGFCPDHITKVP